jgi:predicted anti-sigma-YlaC factor YlaD
MKTLPFFDCRACVVRMSALLDGELSPVARFVSRVHVRFCRDCRVHEGQLKATLSVLRARRDEGPALPDEARAKLLERLRAGGTRSQR